MARYWSRYPTGLYFPVEEHVGVILSSGLLIPVELPPLLIEALNNFILPPDAADWHQQILLSQVLKLRAFFSYEFLIKRFAVPIPEWKIQVTNPQCDELIDAYSALWVAAWNMLDWLNSHQHLNLPSAEFYCLVNELILLTPGVAYLEDGKPKGANVNLSKIQKQNRSLQYKKNPFSPKRYPHTYRIIGAALAIANLNEDFRKNLFMPVVRSRMKCMTVADSQKPRSYDLDGYIERRGRGGPEASKPRRRRPKQLLRNYY